METSYKNLIKTIPLLLIIGIFDVSQACECNFYDFDTNYAKAKFIFVGKLIGKKQFKYNKSKIINLFSIEQIWKVPKMDTVSVVSGKGGPDCGYPFEQDSTYIVYVCRTHNGFYETNRCIRTCKLTDSPDLINLAARSSSGNFFKTDSLSELEFTFLERHLENKSILDQSRQIPLFVFHNRIVKRDEFFKLDHYTLNKLKGYKYNENIHKKYSITHPCVIVSPDFDFSKKSDEYVRKCIELLYKQ